MQSIIGKHDTGVVAVTSSMAEALCWHEPTDSITSEDVTHFSAEQQAGTMTIDKRSGVAACSYQHASTGWSKPTVLTSDARFTKRVSHEKNLKEGAARFTKRVSHGKKT